MNTTMPSPEPFAARLPQGPAQLRCIGCRKICSQPTPDYRCSDCGNLLEAVYGASSVADASAPTSPDALKGLWCSRKTLLAPEDLSGVWRFRELLPILRDVRQAVTLREGNTPVYELPRCARSAGVTRLLAKHQGMNPTASFKDTGMTAALSVAREQGFRWVGCASTGNTSASMAAYAARAGLRALVMIPEGKIAWGKLSQAIDYGAYTLQLKTDFDGCVRILGEVIRRFPLGLLNSVNPFRVEGQKTLAFELMEQLDWEVPAHVIVPGGNLGNSSAIGKGLLELRALGMIDALPRVSIIQAAGANPLARSWRENGGQSIEPVAAQTRATAIRIGNPASWKKAVEVLRATGGTCEEVSEEEIAVAKAEIGSDGVGCEPASATTLAGLKKLVRSGFVQPDESVVLVLTGHVLKDPEYTLDFHQDRMAEVSSGNTVAGALRRPPVVLDAKADAVIQLLEKEKA
jgi:threonine synthase